MEELKNKLITACNESQLDMEALMFVVRDFYRDVIDAFNQAKQRQAAEQQQAASAEPVEAEVIED